MQSLKKILLTVILLMGINVSLSAEEIVGYWMYDEKVSVENAKSEDEEWFLKDVKAKDAIFDNEGNYRKNKTGMGKWEKTGVSNYELTVPNEPVMKIKRDEDHLIIVMDIGLFGIINAYYKKK